MSVQLAVQVMSVSVANVLGHYFPVSHHTTAAFIRMVDRFFDCLNTRNLNEGARKRKPDFNPYTTVDDERFQFLEEFVTWLYTWKENVDNRDGNYSKKDREKIFVKTNT